LAGERRLHTSQQQTVISMTDDIEVLSPSQQAVVDRYMAQIRERRALQLAERRVRAAEQFRCHATGKDLPIPVDACRAELDLRARTLASQRAAMDAAWNGRVCRTPEQWARAALELVYLGVSHPDDMNFVCDPFGLRKEEVRQVADEAMARVDLLIIVKLLGCGLPLAKTDVPKGLKRELVGEKVGKNRMPINRAWIWIRKKCPDEVFREALRDALVHKVNRREHAVADVRSKLPFGTTISIEDNVGVIHVAQIGTND
jgi:hypothetical protein